MDGHRMKIDRTESGRRWDVSCECGWHQPRWAGDRPPTYATEQVAVAQASRHYLKELREAGRQERLNGLAPLRGQAQGMFGKASPAPSQGSARLG